MSHPALSRAVAISCETLTAAEKGDSATVQRLDDERLLLLKSFRRDVKLIATDERQLLNQISQLNDRAIGLLEHHRRSKGREMDLAAVGRRALVAYANTR